VVVLGICQVLIFSVDKVYLQSQTDLAMLGNYSAAIGVAAFIKTIESSVGLLLFPLFSSYIVEKNFDRINSVIKKYELITMGFILPAVFTLSIFSNSIISILYGHKFTDAAPVFSIILFSYFISMILLPYGNLLFGLGKFKETAWLWIIAAVFFFLTAYGLVSKGMLNLKGTGMASSLLLSNLLLLISTIFLIRKYLNDQVKVIPGIKFFLFVLSYFSIVLLFVYKFLPDGLMYQTIIACCTYVLILLIGRILNIFKKEDLLLIKEIFSFGKMKSYVKNELKRK
jgi:O-antigen/teichoic acid export membrane protein